MKLSKVELKSDKNKCPYLVCTYLDKNNKERVICLNHYDLEYSIKGRIKYDIKQKSIK